LGSGTCEYSERKEPFCRVRPVTRGEEVSAEAMMSPCCQNHAAKDNLLHVQNAIMEAVVAG
jgi:ornithine carbamoyltransferase